jgi:hypothetical protein
VHDLCPSKDRGRRESRVSDAPAASCAKVESTRVSHHRFTGTPGLPCAMVLTAYFVLSPVTGLFCHRRFTDIGAIHDPVGPETSPQNLTPAPGRQDHTTSPSATTPFVCTLVDRSRARRTALRPRLRADTVASTANDPQDHSGLTCTGIRVLRTDRVTCSAGRDHIAARILPVLDDPVDNGTAVRKKALQTNGCFTVSTRSSARRIRRIA